jgi:hypothetical protein
MRYETGEELEAVARSRAVESCRGVRPAARLTIRASWTRDTVRKRFISSQSIFLKMLKLERTCGSSSRVGGGMKISARIGRGVAPLYKGFEDLNSWGKRKGDQFINIRGSERNCSHSTSLVVQVTLAEQVEKSPCA